MRNTLFGLGIVVVVVLVAVLSGSSCRSLSGAWVESGSGPHSLLQESALMVRYTQPEYAPSPELYAVRTSEHEIDLETIDDLRRYLVPIDSPDRAMQYLDLVRFLGLEGAPPGLPFSSPNSGGLTPHFEEQAAEFGAAARTAIERADGIEVEEPVIDGGFDAPRLIDLRVRVTRDGRLSWEELREVARGQELQRLLFRAR